MTPDAQLDRCLMALSHATRRAIIDRLSAGETRVTDLAGELPIALNTVSKHIRTLEGAGLVRRRVEGRTHFLSLDRERLMAVRKWMEMATHEWSTRLAALEAHLDQQAVQEPKGEAK